MPKKRKSFNEELYRKISIADLILFSIYLMRGTKEKCTFEGLVRESFFLFPKSLAFPCYSKWPDARKLDRPLRTLRRKKLIAGSPKTVFSLTKLGRKRAEGVAKIFRQTKLFK